MSNFNFNTSYNKFNLDMLFGKFNFYRLVDKGLAFCEDFFAEDIFNPKSMNASGARSYLYWRRKLLYSIFLMKDGDSLFNLSTGEASPWLPKIFIPMHPSLFDTIGEADKTELSNIINRAYANILFADDLEPIPRWRAPTANFGQTYSAKQIVFVLDCYIKAVKNCLSNHTNNPNSNEFKLEKEVLGDNYGAYIVEDFKRVSSKFDTSNISFMDKFSGIEKKDYMAISTKLDVSYQEIYNLFHCKTRFSVLAFLAIYKTLCSKDTMQDLCPIPCFIPVQYNVPREKPMVFFAVCICGNVKEPSFEALENEVIGNNLTLDSDIERKVDLSLFMQEFMLKIKDSYLYNKKMHELEEQRMREELNFKLRYEDRKRSCIEELHQRAIQHDIDSHVLSKYVSEQALEQIDINNLNNYTPLQEEETLPSKFALLARLNQFRTQLSAYCTDLHAGAPLSRSVITIRSLLASLDQNRLLMTDVSGAGSSFKYRLKIFFDYDQEPAEMSDKRFDQQIFIPNDQLGCQAFYMIVNNVIRNTAKHAKRKNTQNEVSICIRFLKKLRPVYIYIPDLLDKVDEINIMRDSPFGEMEQNFYTVEIFSNVIQENITNLVPLQNERICEPFINKTTLEKRTMNKGLGEMICAANYLRGKDVVTANEEENILDCEHYLDIEHIKIFNENLNPISLKAFGLVSKNNCGPVTSTPKGFDSTKMVLTPTNEIANKHHITDSENNSHTCFLWDEVDKMDDITNSYNGFLGYRFFLLKPKQVLVVRDENSTVTDEKAEEMAKHVGVDVVSAEELRSQLEKGVPVNHDILVCDDKELIGKYPALLPTRILSVSDILDFTEPSESETGGESEGHDKSDPFVVHCWEKWVEKLNPIIKSYNTSVNNENDVAYFDDHLNSGIGLFLTALKKAGYAEALSSSAQQHLPDYERNCRDDFGDISLSEYLSNISKAEDIAHYRLLESIDTRILIVDERIQQKSQDIPSLGGDSKVTYQCHWKKCHIDLPDVILSESSKEETAKKILNIIDEALENTYYHFIFIHLGLLEGVFSTLYPTDMNKVLLHKKMEEIAAKGKGRVVFESGRGVPDYFPKNARFVQQTSAENALVEIKSKYMFTSLLHNSRTVNPTI